MAILWPFKMISLRGQGKEKKLVPLICHWMRSGNGQLQRGTRNFCQDKYGNDGEIGSGSFVCKKQRLPMLNQFVLIKRR